MEIFSANNPIRLKRFKNYIKHLPGLVAYYPLWEQSGSIAHNHAPATKGTLNGTISGATQGLAGKVGKAYSFDGINDLVSIADNAVFDSLAELTVGLVIKKNTSSSFEKLLFKNAVLDIGISNVGVIFGELNGVGNPGGWGDTEVDDNSWHICGMTYNGSEINCYVDGVNVETLGSLSGTLGNGGGALELGRHADNQNEHYLGLMQHVFFLSTALSDEEMIRLAELAGLS